MGFVLTAYNTAKAKQLIVFLAVSLQFLLMKFADSILLK